jgi:hypothetical protein
MQGSEQQHQFRHSELPAAGGGPIGSFPVVLCRRLPSPSWQSSLRVFRALLYVLASLSVSLRIVLAPLLQSDPSGTA